MVRRAQVVGCQSVLAPRTATRESRTGLFSLPLDVQKQADLQGILRLPIVLTAGFIACTSLHPLTVQAATRVLATTGSSMLPTRGTALAVGLVPTAWERTGMPPPTSTPEGPPLASEIDVMPKIDRRLSLLGYLLVLTIGLAAIFTWARDRCD
jgi:hypothetical protein